MDKIVEFIQQNQGWLIYVPTILFFVIIVLWLLRGCMKGFRKSSIQFIYMIIAIILAVITFNILVANQGQTLYGIIGSRLDNALNVTMPTDYNEIFNANKTLADINLVDTLSAATFKFFANQLGGIENVPIEYYDYVQSIAEILLRLGVALVSLVVYFIFKIIFWFIYLLLFREGRYKKKMYRRKGYYNKHGLLGGLVGGVRGVIVGTVCVGFLATIIYVATANREPKESKFTDNSIGQIYDIDNFVREFGQTGVINMFNNISVNDMPFYMFFANSILQADFGDNGEVVYATSEIMSITGLAQDLLDLFNAYGGESITMDHLKNPDANTLKVMQDLFASENKVEYAGESRTFQEALSFVVEKYEGSTLLNNLMKLTIGTVITNIDTLSVKLNIPSDNMAVGILSSMFTDDKNDANYISPSDLITFNDCKTMLVAVIDSMNEILDLVDYSINNSVSSGNTEVTLGLTNKALAVVEPVQAAIKNLSIFTDNAEESVVNGDVIVAQKKTKMNNAIAKGVDYAFNTIATNAGIVYSNPYQDENVNWLDDLDGVITAVSSVSTITLNLESALAKPENDNSITKALSEIFASDYQDSEAIDTAYDEVVSGVGNISAVNILLNSDFMYDIVYDKYLNVAVSSVNGKEITSLKLPRDINWSDTIVDGEVVNQGEFRVLFETVKNLVRNGILENIDFKNINVKTIDNVVDILLSDYSTEETVLDYMFNSDVIYYYSSIILSNINSDKIAVMIPESDFVDHNGIKLIKKEQIANLISTTSPVIKELLAKGIESFDQLGTDVNAILDVLANEDVQNSIISSDILVATASNYLVKSVKNDANLANYLVIPSYLTYTDEGNNEAVIQAWIGNSGEFSKILHVLTLTDETTGEKILNVEKLTNNDPSYYVSLTKISESNFDQLVASEVIHYSFTNILQTLPEQDDFKLIIPAASYDASYTDAKVIGTNELYNTLHAASYILKVDETTNQLGYDLNAVTPNKEEIVKSNILQATLINTIYTIANKEENEFIFLPKQYADLNYNESDPNYLFNTTDFNSINWVNNDEIYYILNAIEALELDLNSLISGTVDQNALVDKILLLNDKMPDSNSYRIEIVYDSKVLAMTMTQTLKTNKDLKEYVYVPAEAEEPVDEYGDSYIKVTEWFQMVSGLEYSLGVTADSDVSVLEQLQDINSKVKNIFTGSETDYEGKRDILLKSYILEYTLVQNVYDNIDNNTEMSIVIPEYLAENDYVEWLTNKTETTATDLADRIVLEDHKELSHILDVFYVTEIGINYGSEGFEDKVADLVSVYSLVLVKTDYDSTNFSEIIDVKTHKQEVLVKSEVLKASTLNTILLTNSVKIPADYNVDNVLGLNADGTYNEETTRLAIEHNYLSLNNITSEIIDIFAALNELKLEVNASEPNDININANVVLGLNSPSEIIANETKISVILTSKVLSLTLTNQVEMAITDVKFNELPSQAVVVEGSDSYITEAEWTSVIDALGTNGLGLKEGVDVASQLQDTTALINNILGKKSDEPESDTKYVSSRNIILASYIIEETVKTKMVESLSSEASEGTNSVIIPLDTVWHLERDAEGNIMAGSSSEITILMNMFKMLGLGEVTNNDYADFISNNLNAADVLVLKDDNAENIAHKESLQEEMLNSHILQATMINNVYNIEALAKPQGLDKVTNETNLEDTLWYKNKELQSLFNVSALLDLTGEGSTINFNLNDILNSLVSYEETQDNQVVKVSPIATLATSGLVYLTISNNLLSASNLDYLVSSEETSNLGLIIPYDVVTQMPNYQNQAISIVELQAIIDDLDFLNVTEVTNTGQSIMVPEMTDADINNQDILTSWTLKATISNKIIEATRLDSNSMVYISLDENNQLVDDIDNKASALKNGLNYEDCNYSIFSSTEIKQFIKAINKFNTGDKETFTFRINSVEDLAGVDATILDSNIAHSIISEALVKLNPNGTNDKTYVYLVTETSQEKSTELYPYYSKEVIRNIMG